MVMVQGWDNSEIISHLQSLFHVLGPVCAILQMACLAFWPGTSLLEISQNITPQAWTMLIVKTDLSSVRLNYVFFFCGFILFQV
jgi:hypothetical protein